MVTGCFNGIYQQDSDASNNAQTVRFSQLKYIGKRYYIDGINAKNVGTTKIFTTPNEGLNFYPLFARIFVEDAQTVIVAPIITIGTNSSTYDNILASFTLTELTVTNNFLNLIIDNAITFVSPNTDVFFRIGVAATATTLILAAEIYGDYR